MSEAGRHVVVTGGGTGVGAAVAQAFASAEANVTVLGRRREPLEALAAEYESVAAVPADVTDPDSLASALDTARERHGAVSMMVASAGVSSSAPFHRLRTTDLQAMFEVNVFGVFNSFQAVLGDMREAGWGRLVAVASTAGLIGYPYVSHYCASKHAVVGMVKSLAKELGPSGITANAVCPSFVDTPMTDRTIDNIIQQTGRSRDEAEQALTAANPQGRLISPQEVADAVRWLCSDAARAVNGQTVAVDGGEQ